jgi:large subunit ribosomal protein L17
MHRHGYKGRKFGRERDQRKALIVGLAESLVIRESIETTLPKAKELASYTEKLITKAKKGGLHNRRQVLSGLSTVEAAHKLVDDIAPKLGGRTSGHLRVEKTDLRRGDAAQMARISFVDDLAAKPKAKAEMARISFVDDLSKPVKKPKAEAPLKKPAAKKPAAKPKAAAKGAK